MLVTTTKIAQEQPDLAKRFIAALMKGLVHSIGNPDEAGRILQKNVSAANGRTPGTNARSPS
ncbi:ABC transporter substrate-binding protein [Nonomuraea purpurea]|uniref:ABC transporter substrate-binding protein n=1 Tax=Nonomuraea purpurea TaxID=1849276 RepID=A0ABV8GIK0_9ACTN